MLSVSVYTSQIVYWEKNERRKGMDLLTIKPNQKQSPQEARKHAAVIFTARWSTVELLSFYIRARIQVTKCP